MAASDATPLVAHTREVLHLEDDEFAILDAALPEPHIHTFTARQRTRKVEYIDWDVREIEKDGYPHYMFKEIFEQPRSIQDCMRGRIRKEPEEVRLGGIAGIRAALDGPTHDYHGLWHKLSCRPGREVPFGASGSAPHRSGICV